MPQKIARALARSAREVGADPSHWHGTLDSVSSLMAMLLASQHLDNRRVLIKEAKLKRDDDRRITRFLIASLGDFDAVHVDLEERFPRPNVGSKLAEKIWFNFFDMTVGECKRDADLIRALIIKKEQSTEFFDAG